ncbi:hypothetical protein K402DRAFT_312645, partial [Aulographum hederae CBS 113979]
SQAITPFVGQFEYGHWCTYYYVCILFILMLVHLYTLWQDRASKPTTSGSAKTSGATIWTKALAAGRWISYRRLSIPRQLRGILNFPSFGVLALLLATIVLLTCMVFAARPYYRQHFGYGSPPIAIRSGLMAFACVPILIALAGKANIVTLLTGISHEKLNVIHQWVAWMSLVLSLIHTIPFFTASVWEGGAARVKSEFYRNGPLYSGVPPLAMLLGLCMLSLPPLRKWAYETFYYLHVLMAVTYVGLLFWHADNTEDSWSYLWATIALWLASYLARAFWYTRPLNIHNEWLAGAPTTLTKLAGDMTEIEVLAPPGFTWRPSQHVFLRFPRISPLDNHPFTIVSAPLPKPLTDEKDFPGLQHRQTLTFLARAHAGFTKKLAAYTAASPDQTASAWIDGPYGGITRPIERLYDTMILVAGGTGITASLSWLLHVVQSAKAYPDAVRTKKIVLIWSMKESTHFGWVESLLAEAVATAREIETLDI